MEDKSSLVLVGLGAAAAIGLASIGVYYIGYKRGRLAPGTANALRMKTYENLDDPLCRYILSHNVEDPVLKRLREYTLTLINGRMVTPVEEGKLLTVLCRAIGARKVIDIGVFTGCSAYAMALGLPADGKVIACDVNLEDAMRGQPYWEEGGVASKIDLRIGFASDTLQALIDNGEEGSYDMVFLDADKPNYPLYYSHGIKLLRAGGLFIVDNALYTSTGNVLDPRFTNEATEAIRSLNKAMRDDERLEYVLLNIVEGVAVGMKL